MIFAHVIAFHNLSLDYFSIKTQCVSQKNQHFHEDLYSVESIKNAWVQVDTSSVLM